MMARRKGALCLLWALALGLGGCGGGEGTVLPDAQASVSVEKTPPVSQIESAPDLLPAADPETATVPAETETAAVLRDLTLTSRNDLPARGVVIASSLNLRAAAHSEAQVIAGLVMGDVLVVGQQMGDWYHVSSNLGEGYVNAEFVRLDGEGLKLQRENLLFYDDPAGEFTYAEKEFYMASWSGQPRRFDSKLSPGDFGWEGDIAVVHPDIQAMAKNMARQLYQSEQYSVNCYFGQYYPSAARDDGTVYQTGIHEGIDFGGPALDAPFYSLTDGVVTSVQDGSDRDQYNWIGVQTGDMTVFYVHHSTSYVTVGQTVQKGDRLGLQGDNGARGAYHVHLELVQGNAAAFHRSKNTVLENDSPYDFWRGQGY